MVVSLKNKIIIGLFTILIAVVVGQFFIYKSKTSTLEQENLDLMEQRKDEIKQVRDSAFYKIKELTIISEQKFDSLVKTNKPKYIPYEKLVYMYIDYDSAYSILSRTSYSKGRE